MFAEGEECMFDMDCKFDDGYCLDNICASKNKTDDNVFSSTGEFTKMASLTLTYLLYQNRFSCISLARIS